MSSVSNCIENIIKRKMRKWMKKINKKKYKISYERWQEKQFLYKNSFVVVVVFIAVKLKIRDSIIYSFAP